MAIELIVFLAVWLLPIGIYAGRALGLVGNRTSNFLYGITFIGIGVSFIVGCVLMYVQSGETIKPMKGGYSTIDSDQSIAWHLVAWGIWAALGGALVYAGWGLLKKSRGGRKSI